VPTAQGAGSPRSGKGISPRPTWEEQLIAYLRFTDQQNRAPSQHAEDPGDRNLYSWLRNQRSSLRNGLLLPERVAELNGALPGWSSVVPGGFRSSPSTRAGRNERVYRLSGLTHRPRLTERDTGVPGQRGRGSCLHTQGRDGVCALAWPTLTFTGFTSSNDGG
jgi:hypothetical protein